MRIEQQPSSSLPRRGPRIQTILRMLRQGPHWFTASAEAMSGHLQTEARLRALTVALTVAEERERRRIATGLHDQVVQLLASARLQLDAYRATLPARTPPTPLDQVPQLLDQAIAAIRSLTFELSSPLLSELGLEAALEQLGEQLAAKHGIQIEVHPTPQSIPLSDEMRILLFRIGRELLLNVVAHAQAQQIHIAVVQDGVHVTLSVQDDGSGFDPAAVEPLVRANGGFGLFSIREQMQHIGGRLEINSAPGAGTHVRVVVPYQGDPA